MASDSVATNQQDQDDVAWVEQVFTSRFTSRGNDWILGEPIFQNGVAFKICPIQNITRAYIPVFHRGSLGEIRTIWLPTYEQSSIILNKYLKVGNAFHHIVYAPSLAGIIQTVYDDMDAHKPPNLSRVLLLLGIIASTTYGWSPEDCESGRHEPVFSSPEQANSQVALWIKATLDVLDAAQHSNGLTVEAAQGIIIASFVIGNLEGVSLRYRTLISTATLICRDLGLHRLDQQNSTVGGSYVEAETGRRLWWYLVGTDW
jgi:hypothetical protein